jgi:Tfp pilus assembly protein PilX
MNDVTIIESEKGSALLLALMMLCILTLLGISGSNTTTVDLQIASNEREYVKEFYIADSGWKAGANWLDGLAAPPAYVNTSGTNVRNFGNGGQDVTNSTFPPTTQDDTIEGVPYWYDVAYLSDSIVPGSGAGYRMFTYSSTSNANQTQEIEVRLNKLFRVGY